MLRKKMLRTAWRYKAQFISMIIMIALGAGVFLGFNMEWYSLEKNTAEIYGATGFADYRIVSEKGFSGKVRAINPFSAANPTCVSSGPIGRTSTIMIARVKITNAASSMIAVV